MPPENYAAVTSLDELRALADSFLESGDPVAFDLETGYASAAALSKGSLDIDFPEQFICGFSLTNRDNFARYVPVAHDVGVNLPEYEAWEIIKPVLETCPVICHNAQFELRNCRALEWKGRGPRIDLNIISDTQINSYILAETQYHGLKELVGHYYDHQQAELKTLSDVAMTKFRFNMLEMNPKVISYACEDALWTWRLWRDHHERAVQTAPKIHALEMQILPILVDMAEAGHAVDWDALKEQREYAEPFKDRMADAARAGLMEMGNQEHDFTDLNFNSTPQMRDALFTKLRLESRRTTQKGELSTDKIALEGLSQQHNAVKKILEYREVGNLANRMKKWCTEYARAHDERVHASFNQTVVPSGRFSASDPAIQQLPKKWFWSTVVKKEGVDYTDMEPQLKKHGTFGVDYWSGNFRNFMVAGPGKYLLIWDYSQVELRMFAGLTQEPALLEAFNNGVDIHTATAALMFGVPVEEVDSDLRSKGKTLNFGLLFGMGVDSLADRLGISEAEAQDLFNQYFSTFKLADRWINESKAFGASRHHLKTLLGRVVPLWGFRTDNFRMKGTDERLCINAPCQGAAADTMKVAMVRTKNALTEKGWWRSQVNLINNIHDSLVFEVDNSIDPRELRPILEEASQIKYEGFPTLEMDFEIGLRWGSAESWTDQDVEFADGTWRVVQAAKEEPEVEDVPVEPPTTALVVETSIMPTREQLVELKEFFANHPGERQIVLQTPNGSARTEWRTNVDEQAQWFVSHILGGARVYEEKGLGGLMEGVSL